jgi:hypothetical protein
MAEIVTPNEIATPLDATGLAIRNRRPQHKGAAHAGGRQTTPALTPGDS